MIDDVCSTPVASRAAPASKAPTGSRLKAPVIAPTVVVHSAKRYIRR